MNYWYSVKKIVLLIIVQFNFTTSLVAEPIEIMIDWAYPPYMYSTDRQVKGLYPRLIERAFNRIGQSVVFKPYPWSRALNLSETEKVAIAGIYQNQDRLKIYDFSSPLFEERLVIYVRAGGGFEFSQLSDLTGKKVGLNFGWSYGDSIDRIRKEKMIDTDDTAKDNHSNFRMLIGSRVDCIIIDDLAAQQIISQHGYHASVKQLRTPVTINAGYLAFPKNSNKKELLKKFDRALQQLREDGTYDSIVNTVAQQP